MLAQVEEGPGIALATLDFGQLRAIRARLPALAHRRVL
jgi:nitrilase